MFERERENSLSRVEETQSPARRGLVLICEKCGGRESCELRSDLKSLTKEKFGKGEVRVTLTGCMDLCPKDAIAIAIAPTKAAGEGMRFYVARGGTKSAAEILQLISKLK